MGKKAHLSCPHRIDAEHMLALILEDNPFNSFFARREVEEIGYKVHSVSNFKEAIGLVRTISFSLILIDSDFSSQQNFVHTQNTITLLRDIGGHDAILLLMVSGSLCSIPGQMLRSGVAGFLTKPVTAEAVIAELLKIDGNHIMDNLDASQMSCRIHKTT